METDIKEIGTIDIYNMVYESGKESDGYQVGMIFSDIAGATAGDVSFEDIEIFLLESLYTLMRNFGEDCHLGREQYSSQYSSFEENLGVLMENFVPIREGRISFKFVGDGVIYIVKDLKNKESFIEKAKKYHDELEEKIKKKKY